MRKPDIAYFTVDKKRDARLNWLWTMGGKIYTRNQRNLWMKTQSNFYEYNHSVRFNLSGKDSTVSRDFQTIFFNMIQPSVILAYFPLNYSLEIHNKILLPTDTTSKGQLWFHCEDQSGYRLTPAILLSSWMHIHLLHRKLLQATFKITNIAV